MQSTQMLNVDCQKSAHSGYNVLKNSGIIPRLFFCSFVVLASITLRHGSAPFPVDIDSLWAGKLPPFLKPSRWFKFSVCGPRNSTLDVAHVIRVADSSFLANQEDVFSSLGTRCNSLMLSRRNGYNILTITRPFRHNLDLHLHGGRRRVFQAPFQSIQASRETPMWYHITKCKSLALKGALHLATSAIKQGQIKSERHAITAYSIARRSLSFCSLQKSCEIEFMTLERMESKH